MNKYYLIVEKRDESAGVGVREKWGPYDTREEAVAIKEQNEYALYVTDILLVNET